MVNFELQLDGEFGDKVEIFLVQVDPDCSGLLVGVGGLVILLLEVEQLFDVAVELGGLDFGLEFEVDGFVDVGSEFDGFGEGEFLGQGKHITYKL